MAYFLCALLYKSRIPAFTPCHIFIRVVDSLASLNRKPVSRISPTRATIPRVFSQGCGLLGFQPSYATMADIPASWKSDCKPQDGESVSKGKYHVTSAGNCTLSSCADGHFPVGSKCVAPGSPCVPAHPQPRTSYTMSHDGKCEMSGCVVGSAMRPPYAATSLGSQTCPAGYKPIDTESSRTSASEALCDSAGKNSSDTGSHCVKRVCRLWFSAHASFNTTSSSALSVGGAKQFLLCERDDTTPACVTPGDACDPQHPTYTYTNAGHCVGRCPNGVSGCRSGDKCCPETTRCIAKDLDCPTASKMKHEASNLATQVRSFTDSLSSLTKIFRGDDEDDEKTS